MFIGVFRQVRTSPGAAYDLGYQIVWRPKYRRPVLSGSVRARLEELIWQRAAEIWSRSFFVATVGAVSADAVRRYIDTQCERVAKRGDV